MLCHMPLSFIHSEKESTSTLGIHPGDFACVFAPFTPLPVAGFNSWLFDRPGASA